jgi:hypothetical protein
MERAMNKLTGLKIKLDRPADRERPCCLNICTIGAARGPHTGELRCANCGQHRGWLSNVNSTMDRARSDALRRAHHADRRAQGSHIRRGGAAHRTDLTLNLNINITFNMEKTTHEN